MKRYLLNDDYEIREYRPDDAIRALRCPNCRFITSVKDIAKRHQTLRKNLTLDECSYCTECLTSLVGEPISQYIPNRGVYFETKRKWFFFRRTKMKLGKEMFHLVYDSTYKWMSEREQLYEEQQKRLNAKS